MDDGWNVSGRGRPQDWKQDIAAYDKVHEQILRMADALSAGILKRTFSSWRFASEQ